MKQKVVFSHTTEAIENGQKTPTIFFFGYYVTDEESAQLI
jgi:hypothetical protein